MARFNPDTYPDRKAFDAYARALRRQEFDRMAAAARKRFVVALRRVWRTVVRGAGSMTVAVGAASPRRGSH
jgi:hypothetical protein